MADVLLWLEALAGLKALFDLTEGAGDYFSRYTAHKREQATVREARRAAQTLSTYSDDEVWAIIRRIEGCRDRFIEQGSGRERSRCICSVLNEIAEGNGGIVPIIDHWREMYDQLGCESMR
jgi:hypothetical protein